MAQTLAACCSFKSRPDFNRVCGKQYDAEAGGTCKLVVDVADVLHVLGHLASPCFMVLNAVVVPHKLLSRQRRVNSWTCRSVGAPVSNPLQELHLLQAAFWACADAGTTLERSFVKP